MAVVPAADGRYLRELLGKPFTDEQLRIITAELCPQLVIAGAGSGKTTVMAARVVHAIAWHKVRPDGILGLTFTNKAAAELAERVRLALAQLARLDDHGELVPARLLRPEPDDQPTVSTYHAYAASLIKDHALRIGREPDSRLLTEAGRWQLALRVVRAAPGPYTTWTWTPRTVAERLLDLDGAMSDHLVSSDQVRALNRSLIDDVSLLSKTTKALLAIKDTAQTRDELLDLVDRYRQRKRDLDLVDFGDQVALAAEIARSCPEVGEAERERFPVVFLDEYQDTGVAQRVLLADLFNGGHPVTAVGDPCQSIYGWRGASIGNLLRFFEHFPSDVPVRDPLYLLTSFRNGGRILDGANQLSDVLRADKQDARRPHVPVPSLMPGRDEPGHVRTALLSTVADEVEWLADRLGEALQGGVPASEIAVLCRRRSDFAMIHRALGDKGIPVEVVGLGGLLEMPEVADVVAVLEVLADPTANAALARILTGPRYRVGPRDLKALGSRADRLSRGTSGGRSDSDNGRALAEAADSVDTVDVVALTDALDDLGTPSAYSPEGYERLDQLRHELAGFRPLLVQPIVEAVVGVIAGIGLDVEIEATPSALAQGRAANLSAFLDHAAGFEGVEGESDLAAFLDYLAAAGDKERGLDIGGVSTAETVKLMTVHKAKGLEWSVVALPGLVHEVFPSRQGRAQWVKRAEALPHELRGDADDLPLLAALTSPALNAFAQECKDQDAEEERRLAYVAATRAKDLLLASGYIWSATRKKACDTSAFLTELRKAVPPDPAWDDPWEDIVEGNNPLLEVAAPDVLWPAPYREGPAAHRRAAADLVLAAKVGAAASEPSGQVAEWEREVDQLLDELAATSAAVRDVVLPRTLSASQVVALAADPDGFARSLARPMPRRPSAAARKGTAFHAWVEHLFDATPLFDTDELTGAAEDAWSVGSADDPDGPDLAELQASFAEGPYGDRSPYAVEAPFELVVAGRLVRGRIDAVYRTPDGFDVVDYKTGLRPGNPKAVALQLAIYRLAWAGIAGVPVEQVGAAFLYVRTGQLVRPELAGAEEIAALLVGEPVELAPVAPVTGSPAQALLRPAPVPAAAPIEPEGQLSLEW